MRKRLPAPSAEDAAPTAEVPSAAAVPLVVHVASGGAAGSDAHAGAGAGIGVGAAAEPQFASGRGVTQPEMEFLIEADASLALYANDASGSAHHGFSAPVPTRMATQPVAT